MLTLCLIGIGCGDPEQLTLAAVRAVNAADLVLIPRKGEDKTDLAELRRETTGLLAGTLGEDRLRALRVQGEALDIDEISAFALQLAQTSARAPSI